MDKFHSLQHIGLGWRAIIPVRRVVLLLVWRAITPRLTSLADLTAVVLCIAYRPVKTSEWSGVWPLVSTIVCTILCNDLAWVQTLAFTMSLIRPEVQKLASTLSSSETMESSKWNGFSLNRFCSGIFIFHGKLPTNFVYIFSCLVNNIQCLIMLTNLQLYTVRDSTRLVSL